MPVENNQFRQVVSKNGGILQPQSQGNFTGGHVSIQDRACTERSAQWLRDQKRHHSNQAAIDNAQRCEEIIWMADIRYNKYKKDVIKKYLDAYSVQKQGQEVTFHNEVSMELAASEIAARNAYYFFGAKGSRGKGHAIAISTVNGYRLFDPNYGVASFTNAEDLINTFKLLWRKTYHKLFARGYIQRYR